MPTGLIIDHDFTDASLPTALTYTESIGAVAGVGPWLVPDAARVTVAAGRVSAVLDRASAGIALTQPSTDYQPLFGGASGPGGRPALTFDRARVDRLLAGNIVPVTGTAKWSKVALINAALNTGSTYWDIMSGATASDTIGIGVHRLAITSTNIVHKVGKSGAVITRYTPHIPDTWQLIMATWDGATATARISSNGAAWQTTTIAGVTVTDADLRIGCVGIGFGFGGLIADAAFFAGIDLSAAANAALLSTIKQYFRDRYALTVA